MAGIDGGPCSRSRLDPALRLGRDHLDAGQGLQPAGCDAFHVVAIDYGAKRNILRLLTIACAVTVVPATASAEHLALEPDGVVLSNGPGRPAATGEYAVPTIQSL